MNYNSWKMENQKQDSWNAAFYECLGFLTLYNRYPTLSEKNIKHLKIHSGAINLYSDKDFLL